MKKPISLILFLFFLSLLSACQTQKDATPTETPLPVKNIAQAISSLNADEPEGIAEIPDEQLSDYIEAVYGLTSDMWEDGSILQAGGMRAYEISVLRFTDENHAKSGEAALEEYRNAREGAFGGYAPEQAALVSGSTICRVGQYVGLFICENPESAEEVFISLLETGKVPSSINKSEPTQYPQPDPETITGMDAIKDALLDFCNTDLAALGNYNVTSFASDKAFPEMVADTYGIVPAHLADGFVVNDLNDDPFELIVLRMIDKDTADYNLNALRTYKKEEKERYIERDSEGIGYITAGNEESYDLLSNAHLIQSNEFLALLICQDSEGANACFKTALDSIRSEETGIPTPTPVEITDGVFFVEVSWNEVDGEPDPNHPDRTLYVQPNKEDMSIYDTTAIIDAWSMMDDSQLSPYEKSIYDSAKSVLELIIFDGMSEFEKEVAIYEWILQNVTYDWSYTNPLQETTRDSYTPYGGLINHSAVCLGYATTFQLLTELAGIESLTVVGTGRGKDHGWNMIQLNGEWFCVDITWDVPYYNPEKRNLELRFFNTTSDYMAKTGHQWDYNSIPEATAENHGFITQS